MIQKGDTELRPTDAGVTSGLRSYSWVPVSSAAVSRQEIKVALLF